MTRKRTATGEFQEILARKEAELVQVLRKRDGIAIEKSTDEMDEIQNASERDLGRRDRNPPLGPSSMRRSSASGSSIGAG